MKAEMLIDTNSAQWPLKAELLLYVPSRLASKIIPSICREFLFGKHKLQLLSCTTLTVLFL